MLAKVAVCLYCSAELRPTEQGPFCCAACAELFEATKFRALSPELSTYQTQVRNFAFLDQPEVKSKFFFRPNEMSFYVKGLHCASCVHLLEQLQNFNADVLESRVNFGESTLWIRAVEGARWSAIAACLSELGYPPSPLSPDSDPRERYKDENRRYLTRIGVAGACAGNMMLFTVPVYAGLAGAWAEAFNRVTFVLFLPVLFYSAIPFYRGAWTSLKYRTINVDLPIVVAFVTGFTLSTMNLIRGEGAIYFDSTAGFLFLILSSRFLLKRLQQKYESGLAPEQVVSPSVAPDENIDVKQFEKLLVDGVLLDERAEIDMSLFSGESLPQVFTKGMEVFAGTQLVSKDVRVRVTKVNENTRLGQLMALLKTEAIRKSPFVALTDRLAQGLIVFVFSLAVLVVLFRLGGSYDESLQRALALIVVACPCALAFGAPLTYGLALRKARSRGIIIKNATALEKLTRVQNIFLDKTGTLTGGTLHLTQSVPRALTDQEKKLILALESESHHPIAFALRKAWPEFGGLPKIHNLRETLGQGVQGFHEGIHYELRASRDVSANGLGVDFLVNGQFAARIYFADRIRPDTVDVVDKLKNKNLYLVSGDSTAQVLRVASECGIALENSYGQLSPEDKLSMVQAAAQTCMVGDGANDALALKAADVGIAVKGSIDLSLHSADVYLTRGGLSPLIELFAIAQNARATLQRNLAISFAYNAIGGGMALAGLINPLAAAVLMPISSVLLLISSLWGSR